MIVLGIAAASLLIWLALVGSGFWRTDINDRSAAQRIPETWPAVVAIVPARNEADVIARSIGSLVAQDYPGNFSILLVDDDSSDGTADVARGLGSHRLHILPAAPLAPGWTGKLWAVSQGVAAAGAPDYLWLTDADIEHAPDTLRVLVGIAAADDRQLVSFMAKLRCDTPAERALIPAFIFFFQMLYPFARVNRPQGQGAAAGGCMLVRRTALEAAGGIAAIRDALIDDCTLGALLKRQGPIWLGLTDRSRSIRPYDTTAPIAAMIARSAYAQLDYSPVKLVGTILGLALVYFSPPLLVLAGTGVARWFGLAAWLLMAASFQPMLHFYRRSPLWGLALPAIAAFYAGCTILSAWQHKHGRGGMWKGRAQAAVGQ
jgi:hopene-associated glycosyltransferase HpnB